MRKAMESGNAINLNNNRISNLKYVKIHLVTCATTQVTSSSIVTSFSVSHTTLNMTSSGGEMTFHSTNPRLCPPAPLDPLKTGMTFGMSSSVGEGTSSNPQIFRLKGVISRPSPPAPRLVNSISTSTVFPRPSSTSKSFLQTSQNTSRVISSGVNSANTTIIISPGQTVATTIQRSQSPDSTGKYIQPSTELDRIIIPKCGTVFRSHEGESDTLSTNTVLKPSPVPFHSANVAFSTSVSPKMKKLVPDHSALSGKTDVYLKNQCLFTNAVVKANHVGNGNSKIYQSKVTETLQNTQQRAARNENNSKNCGNSIQSIYKGNPACWSANSLSRSNKDIPVLKIKAEKEDPVIHSNSITTKEASSYEKVDNLKTCADAVTSAVSVNFTPTLEKSVCTTQNVPLLEPPIIALPCISVQGTPMALCPVKINTPGLPSSNKVVAFPIPLPAGNATAKTVPEVLITSGNSPLNLGVGNQPLTISLDQINGIGGALGAIEVIGTKFDASDPSKSSSCQSHHIEALPKKSSFTKNSNQSNSKTTASVSSTKQQPLIGQTRSILPMTSTFASASTVQTEGSSVISRTNKAIATIPLMVNSPSVASKCSPTSRASVLGNSTTNSSTVQSSTNMNSKKPLEGLDSINKMKVLNNLPPSEALKVAFAEENPMPSKALHVTDKRLFTTENQSLENGDTDNNDSETRNKPYPVLLVPNINNQKYVSNERKVGEIKSCDSVVGEVDGIESCETQKAQSPDIAVIRNEDNVKQETNVSDANVITENEMASDTTKAVKMEDNVISTNERDSLEKVRQGNIDTRDKERQILENSCDIGNVSSIGQYKPFVLKATAGVEMACKPKSFVTETISSNPAKNNSFQNKSVKVPKALGESNVLLFQRIKNLLNKFGKQKLQIMNLANKLPKADGKSNDSSTASANMISPENTIKSSMIVNNSPLTVSSVADAVPKSNSIRREDKNQILPESRTKEKYKKYGRYVSTRLKHVFYQDFHSKLQHNSSNKAFSSSEMCKPCKVVLERLPTSSYLTGKKTDNCELRQCFTSKNVQNINGSKDENTKQQPNEKDTSLIGKRVTETVKGELTKYLKTKKSKHECNIEDKNDKQPFKSATELTNITNVREFLKTKRSKHECNNDDKNDKQPFKSATELTNSTSVRKYSKTKKAIHECNNEDKNDKQPFKSATELTNSTSVRKYSKTKKAKHECNNEDKNDKQPFKSATELTNSTSVRKYSKRKKAKHECNNEDKNDKQPFKSATELTNSTSVRKYSKTKKAKHECNNEDKNDKQPFKSATELTNSTSVRKYSKRKKAKHECNNEDKNDKQPFKSATELTNSTSVRKYSKRKKAKHECNNEDKNDKQPFKSATELTNSTSVAEKGSNTHMKCLMLSLHDKNYVIMVPNEAFTDKPPDNGGTETKLNTIVMEVRPNLQTAEQLHKPNEVGKKQEEMVEIFSSPPPHQSHSVQTEDCHKDISDLDQHAVNISPFSSDDMLPPNTSASEKTVSCIEISDSDPDSLTIDESERENTLKRKSTEVHEENDEINGKCKKAKITEAKSVIDDSGNANSMINQTKSNSSTMIKSNDRNPINLSESSIIINNYLKRRSAGPNALKIDRLRSKLLETCKVLDYFKKKEKK